MFCFFTASADEETLLPRDVNMPHLRRLLIIKLSVEDFLQSSPRIDTSDNNQFFNGATNPSETNPQQEYTLDGHVFQSDLDVDFYTMLQSM